MYPDDLLDEFDAAIGKVADAMNHVKEHRDKASEGAAKRDLDVARAAFAEINAKLDEYDALAPEE